MVEKINTKYNVPSDLADNNKLNKLRAAVLGANDGVVSVSSIVMGVAGATSDAKVISLAGLAALIAGALSMAVGEYVSVSSQSDAEKAYIKQEKSELHDDPEGELDELTREYIKHGLEPESARTVAEELTRKDALRAHLKMHLNLDPDDINSPWQAAWASLTAFTVGGLVPMLAVWLVSASWRIATVVISVVVALVVIGILSAIAGNAGRLRAIIRVVLGGIVAMAITYGVGLIFGVTAG